MIELDTKINFQQMTNSDDLLEEDLGEPKTLDELAELHGFPFKAEAVIHNSDPHALPVGTRLMIIGKVIKEGESHPYLPDETKTDKNQIGHMWRADSIYLVVPNIKRWIFIK